MPPPLQPPYVTDAPTTFIIDGGGRLVEPFQLQYIVFDTSTEAKLSTPLQVFPSSGRATAEEVSLGYYRAPYTPGGSEAKGRRAVRWYCTMEDGDTERTWTTPWEVLTGPLLETPWPRYALVSDLRAEGITTQRLTDVRAFELLDRASKIIADATGRVFAPVPKALTVSSKGRRSLLLGEEIIALDRVLVSEGETNAALDVEEVLVFARHLSQRMFHPDDRNNPRLETRGGRFPDGRQNIHVFGVFGYTDPDGSPMGRTPEAIKRAAIMLVSREVPLLGTSSHEDASLQQRVIREKTRDQEVWFSPLEGGSSSGTTGVRDVDLLLASYVRPPALGAA